jgi:hypothetical protein
MTRFLSSTFAAVALAGLVGVAAQTPQEPRQRDEQAPRGKTVTLTGCIAKPDARSAEGSTAPFVLKNAEGGTASTYALVPTPGADLASHVNHKVEVTGTMSRQSSDSGPSSARSSDPNRPTGGDTPTLAVQSVKMIASSCTS